MLTMHVCGKYWYGMVPAYARTTRGMHEKVVVLSGWWFCCCCSSSCKSAVMNSHACSLGGWNVQCCPAVHCVLLPDTSCSAQCAYAPTTQPGIACWHELVWCISGESNVLERRATLRTTGCIPLLNTAAALLHMRWVCLVSMNPHCGRSACSV
jgi:hypothetical protein